MTNVATVTILRDVTKLVVGDVIAAAYLPLRRAGRVIFVRHFAPNERERWVFVAYEMDNGRIDGTAFLASEGVRLDSEAGRRLVAGEHVVHECCGKLDDAPHENFCAHYRPAVAPVPSGAVADRRSCVDPGDQEYDHEMCRDAVAESAGGE